MPPARGVAVKAALLVVSTLTVMSGATIAPTLPDVAAAYGSSKTLTQTVLTAPALAIALIAPFGGLVLDRLGRRPVLLASIALYAIAGTAGLWLPVAWGIGPLIASRIVLGVSVAGVMSGATTLIGDYFEGPERAGVLGFQGVAMSGGGLLFLLAGGALGEWSWRGPFAVYALAAAMLPLAWALLDEPDRAEPSTGSASIATPSAVPWSRLAAVCGLAFAGMGLFYLVPTQFPFLLERLGTTGALRIGIAVAASTVAGGLAGSVFAPVRRGLGPAGVAGLLFGCMAAGFAVAWAAGGYAMVVAASVLVGAGTGLLLPLVNAWLMDGTPPVLRGRLIGASVAALFSGQFLSPLLAAPLAARFGPADLFLAGAALAAAAGLGFGVLRLRTAGSVAVAAADAA